MSSETIFGWRAEHREACRHPRCGRPLFFVPTEASEGAKSIPLDWDPVQHGSVLIVDLGWGQLRARVLGKKAARPDGTVLFLPHHASCLALQAFRAAKAKRAARAKAEP